MSTVAVINPAVRDSAGTAPSSVDAGHPATAFADLLDQGGEKPDKQQKTNAQPVYSFAELGMFGLHKLVLSADQQADAAAEAPAARITALANVSKETATHASAPRTPSHAAAPLVYVPVIEVSDRPALPEVQGIEAAGAGSPLPGAASRAKAGDAGSPQSARSASAKLPEPLRFQTAANATPKGRDTLNVSVSGPDEALAIAIRSGADGSQEVTRLRQLIESTVAHFEMDIAQLHVNGTSVETAFSLGGMANGGSAR